MNHTHEINGEGHRIRCYANGTIKIRLYGTHHADVEAIAGRDGHVDAVLDAVLENCDASKLEAAISDPMTAQQCVAFAKAQLARLSTAGGRSVVVHDIIVDGRRFVRWDHGWAEQIANSRKPMPSRCSRLLDLVANLRAAVSDCVSGNVHDSACFVEKCDCVDRTLKRALEAFDAATANGGAT